MRKILQFYWCNNMAYHELETEAKAAKVPFRMLAQETVTRWSSTLAAMITLICNHRAMTICAALHACWRWQAVPGALVCRRTHCFVCCWNPKANSMISCIFQFSMLRDLPMPQQPRRCLCPELQDHFGKSIQQFNFKASVQSFRCLFAVSCFLLPLLGTVTGKCPHL